MISVHEINFCRNNFYALYMCLVFILDSPADPSRKLGDDSIIFTEVQTGSSAVYQCNVSNEYGYLLANAFVNVLGNTSVLNNFIHWNYSLNETQLCKYYVIVMLLLPYRYSIIITTSAL